MQLCSAHKHVHKTAIFEQCAVLRLNEAPSVQVRNHPPEVTAVHFLVPHLLNKPLLGNCHKL